MKDIVKEDFVANLVKKTGNPYLSTIGIELTLRCNLNCRFCYLRRKSSKELSEKKLLELADEITELGFVTVTFMGGEPLLRKDFSDIYSYFYDKGLLIIIHTNGTVLNERVVKLFKKRPPFNLVISIYGGSDDVYQRLCGRKVFTHLKRNLIMLKENNINFKIIVLITKEMLGEWRKVKGLVEELNVWSFFAAARLSSPHRGICNVSYRATERDLKIYPSLPPEFKKAVLNVEKYLKHPKFCDGYFYINTEGKLQLCHALQQPSFDISSGGLKKMVDNLVYGKIKLKCPWR